MGNSTPHSNPDLMIRYIRIQQEFAQEFPLYDVSDIEFPLSTRGAAIVDHYNRRVKLAGVSWMGAQTSKKCVSGLDTRSLNQICKQIKQVFGFNSVRLGFSMKIFQKDGFIDQEFIKANDQLLGLTAGQIFDRTVQALTDFGLMVYLYDCQSQTQSYAYQNKNQKETDQYSKQQYFELLQSIVYRYCDNQRVIGIDIGDHLPKSKKGMYKWTQKQQNWHIFATQIGNKIHQIAPEWLIIMGGMTNRQGNIIEPIELVQRNKLVYGGRYFQNSFVYSFMWKFLSQQWFRQQIFNRLLHIRALGVPFVLTEFSCDMSNPMCKYLINLLTQLDLDWTYFSLNCNKNDRSSSGLCSSQISSFEKKKILSDLKKISRPSFKQIS